MARSERMVAVYAADGLPAFVGTVGECARMTGVSEHSIRSAVAPRRQERYARSGQRGYRFYPVEDDGDVPGRWGSAAMAQAPYPEEGEVMLKKTMDAIMAEFDRLDGIEPGDEAMDAEIKRAKAVGSLAAQVVSVSRQVTDIVRLRAEMGGGQADEQIRGLLDA